MAEKTRREKLDELVEQIASIADDCENEANVANDHRDAALVEAASREIEYDLRGPPITEESLSQFLDLVDAGSLWMSSIGRLKFWCRIDGSWGVEFNSTYGGSVGSYRKLKTITEVKILVELLGVMTNEQRRRSE